MKNQATELKENANLHEKLRFFLIKLEKNKELCHKFEMWSDLHVIMRLPWPRQQLAYKHFHER